MQQFKDWRVLLIVMKYDSEAMKVQMGCIAQETTDSDSVDAQIGANWAVSRSLVAQVEQSA